MLLAICPRIANLADLGNRQDSIGVDDGAVVVLCAEAAHACERPQSLHRLDLRKSSAQHLCGYDTVTHNDLRRALERGLDTIIACFNQRLLLVRNLGENDG